MDAKLAKLLVESEGIPVERLDEAVRIASQSGERLDTVLLKMQLIDETRLTDVLAQAYDMPSADFKALVKVDLKALKLLPSRIAERCQVFPFLTEGDKLFVLSPAPPDNVLLEEIGEMVHKTIVPHVATAYRVAHALTHFYGLPLADRFQRIEAGSSANSQQNHKKQQSVYANPATQRIPVPADTKRKDRPELSHALALLAGAKTRQQVVHHALEYARHFVDCAVFFGIKKKQAGIWDASGAGAWHAEWDTVSIPIDQASVLRTVTETSTPYIGKLVSVPLHDALLSALDRHRPHSIFVFPVLVAGRVVALFYTDNGTEPLRAALIADLITYCGRLGSAFENIIIARKKTLKLKTNQHDTKEVTQTAPSTKRVDESFSDQTQMDKQPTRDATEELPLVTDDTTLVMDPSLEKQTQKTEPEPAEQVEEEPVVFEQTLETEPEPAEQVEENPVLVDEENVVLDSALISGPDYQLSPDTAELNSWDEQMLKTLGTLGQASAEGQVVAGPLQDAHPEDQTHPDEEPVFFADTHKPEFGNSQENDTGFDGSSDSFAVHKVDPQLLQALNDAAQDIATDNHPDEESLELTNPDIFSGAQVQSLDVDDDDILTNSPEIDISISVDQDDIDTQKIDPLEIQKQLHQHTKRRDVAVVMRDETSGITEQQQKQAIDEQNSAKFVDASTSTNSDFDEKVRLDIGHPREILPDTQKTETVQELSLVELNRLCDTLAGEPGKAANAAFESLDSKDVRLLPLLVARFPGTVAEDPFGREWHVPEPDRLSVLIRYLVAHPALGAEVALAHLESNFPAQRWFAAYLFKYIHDPRAIRSLVQRLHDEEPRIRHLAAEVLHRYEADAGFDSVLQHLRKRLNSPVLEVRRRGLYFLGFFKDIGAVPQLIDSLGAREPELVSEARQALCAISMQDFSDNQRKWLKWWHKNHRLSRIEWMIEGLRHRDRNIRYAAMTELSVMAGETFGYNFDAKKRDREQAVRRWEKWWKGEKKRMRID